LIILILFYNWVDYAYGRHHQLEPIHHDDDPGPWTVFSFFVFILY
jgi:hypothetical protein